MAGKPDKKAVLAKAPEPSQKGDPVLPIKRDHTVTWEEQMAGVVVGGVAGNAIATAHFHGGLVEMEELPHLVAALDRTVARSKAGGTEQADELLSAQAVTLNAIFVHLAQAAAKNITNLRAFEVYTRLALKAQSQSRCTMESLAEIKNPRSVAFVKQANIAGGHQQVNNGVEAGGFEPAQAREETEVTPSKLLEAAATNVTRLDTRKTSQAGRGDPQVETLGAVNRPTNRRRKGGRVA